MKFNSMNTSMTYRTCWIVFMVVAASLPYIVNYVMTPVGQHYTWILPPFPQDSLGYMAWSEQSARGALLFQIKYTALQHAPFLFHPVFLLCGWLKALLGWDMGIIHLIMKALGIVLFWLMLFKYLDHLKLRTFPFVAATVLTGTSSGLGWVASTFFTMAPSPPSGPADLWVPDINTFWSLLWNPLFAYSLAGLLLCFYLLDKGTAEGNANYMWLSGLVATLLTSIHPYHVPVTFSLAALLAFIRLRHKAWGMLVRFYVAALPFVVVTALISWFHPIVARHNASGVMTSPPLQSYLLALGLPFVLVLVGIAIDRRDLLKRYPLLVLWIVLALVLSYFPFWFQRKFIFGVHIPVCILAAVSLDLLLAKVPQHWHKRAVTAGILLLMPLLLSTQIFLLSTGFRSVKNNDEGYYYIDDNMIKALSFLRKESTPSDLVFAVEGASTLIPVYAGNRAIWGHWAMSVDFDERIQWVRKLALGYEDPVRGLVGEGVKYILVDEEFRQLFRGMEQRVSPGYSKVFESGSVAVYRVGGES